MSRHHIASDHATKTRAIRPVLAAQLPLPCVEGCGRLVVPGEKWHVAHIVPAALGGRTTLDNVGVAHAHCNHSAGARLGNAITARERAAANGIRAW
jgi:5-methylcytosine-specific restriction endonuclease McrA